MNIRKKLNFKQPKYILPLVALPFALFLGYQLGSFFEEKEEVKKKQTGLATYLGEIQDSILSKNEAYELRYQNKDARTMIDVLEEEEDSVLYYTDQLTKEQKRFIDSLDFIRKEQRTKKKPKSFNESDSYYKPKNAAYAHEDEDIERSLEIIRLLNGDKKGERTLSANENSELQRTNAESKEKENPTQMLREQLFLLDSLEKANTPEFQEKWAAKQRQKEAQKRKEDFLSNTMKVSKKSKNKQFNHISSENEENFIKAVIDENTKGYLGSRIRFRIVEDIFVGNHKIPNGSILYGLISGFDLQRVNINIVSVQVKGKILPVNLSVYDLDGMKGLYVPKAMFREMIREFGTSSVQGTSLDNKNQNFFSSLLSKAFSSTSQTIAKVIRKNKAKLKYNTHIYLINENELQNEK